MIRQFFQHETKLFKNEKFNKFCLKTCDAVWWSTIWGSLAWGSTIAIENTYNSLAYYGINEGFDKVELTVTILFSMIKGGLHCVTGPVSMSWFAMTYCYPEKFGITVKQEDYANFGNKKRVQKYYRDKAINGTLTPQDIIMHSYFVPFSNKSILF